MQAELLPPLLETTAAISAALGYRAWTDAATD
jgi:hypothetical protein